MPVDSRMARVCDFAGHWPTAPAQVRPKSSKSKRLKFWENVTLTYVTINSTMSCISNDKQTYPMQKQALTVEYLRDHCHLRARTREIGAMLRLRDTTTRAIHDYFKVRSS